MSHRFTMSGMFAGFLETVTVEEEGAETYLTCTKCAEQFCEIEDGDTLEVLLVTALKHDDECPVRLASLGATDSTD